MDVWTAGLLTWNIDTQDKPILIDLMQWLEECGAAKSMVPQDLLWEYMEEAQEKYNRNTQ